MAKTRRYRDVPPFLRDADAAFRWARRNVPSVEEDLFDWPRGSPTYEYAISDYENKASLYSDFADEAYAAGRVQIYRAIRVRQNGHPYIRFDCLGKAWSRTRKGAGVYGIAPKKNGMQDVVLTGIVNPYDVDWAYGFTSFMYYGEDQWEVSLLPKTPVLVTAIDDVAIAPVQGSSGTAGETWRETC